MRPSRDLRRDPLRALRHNARAAREARRSDDADRALADPSPWPFALALRALHDALRGARQLPLRARRSCGASPGCRLAAPPDRPAREPLLRRALRPARAREASPLLAARPRLHEARATLRVRALRPYDRSLREA